MAFNRQQDLLIGRMVSLLIRRQDSTVSFKEMTVLFSTSANKAELDLWEYRS